MISFRLERLKTISLCVSFSSGRLRWVKTIIPAAAMACDATVAIAAPSIPISKDSMSIRSRAMFSTTETDRKINGVTESPTARSRAA